jgi:hypothetical protein
MNLIYIIAKIAFWVGVALMIQGLLMSFYPGAECWYFSIVAGLLPFGVILRKKAYKIASILLAVFAIYCVYGGYQRGVQYRDWLSTQKKEPNHAPEPTPMAVMPPAMQEPRQP